MLAVAASAVFFLTEGPLFAAPYKNWPAKKEEKPGITQIQIQSEIMGYAETFSQTIIQAFDDFYAHRAKEDKQAFFHAHADTLTACASALTLAAEPNPSAGMLDLAVMITLGRMIWEEYWLPRFGEQAREKVDRFQMMEKWIWAIVAKVLTVEEQRELRDMITEWRKGHPKQVAFSHIRFNDFAEYRRKSTLTEGEKPSGMFKPVAEAAQAADEMRLLGERALFLGTRMPLLGGGFADLWVSRILLNPEMQRILDNMDKVSNSATQLSDEMRKLPDQFAVERDVTIDKTMERVTDLRKDMVEDVMQRVTLERTAAIDQLMDRVADERQAIFEDLTPQGEGREGLLPELQSTLALGNEMSSNILQTAEILNPLHQEIVTQHQDDTTPFVIREYTEALAQASIAAQEFTALVKAVNELLLPEQSGERPMLRFVNAMDRIRRGGEQLIDYTFYRGLLLIIAALAVILAVMIVFRLFSIRVLERHQAGRNG